ncbi:MAG: hypothetical protein BWY72_02480 [Bacteroidetes bacterium ADurb.Bin416]|nr:MAG: hypothetical protein BWY72_02480 [Bacteroidetes bacterium ADurb.Bin416]
MIDTVTLATPVVSTTDSVPQAVAADSGSHEEWALKLLHKKL